MCLNNNSRDDDTAPLQTSPAFRVANSSTSTSHFLDPAFAVDSMLNTNHRAENAKKCMLRCFRKTDPILLATCVFISCLLVRYLTGSVVIDLALEIISARILCSLTRVLILGSQKMQHFLVATTLSTISVIPSNLTAYLCR